MSLNLEAPTYSTLMIPIHVLTVWADLSQAQHKGSQAERSRACSPPAAAIGALNVLSRTVLWFMSWK